MLYFLCCFIKRKVKKVQQKAKESKRKQKKVKESKRKYKESEDFSEYYLFLNPERMSIEIGNCWFVCPHLYWSKKPTNQERTFSS
jgi:hypothetical protein